ncbi:hypothetical protein ABPG73_018910 [Tetrahymena malaccensis]
MCLLNSLPSQINKYNSTIKLFYQSSQLNEKTNKQTKQIQQIRNKQINKQKMSKLKHFNQTLSFVQTIPAIKQLFIELYASIQQRIIESQYLKYLFILAQGPQKKFRSYY